jgi:hypothetical protein
LSAWLDYLGIGSGSSLKIESYFTNKLVKVSGFDFITGWGSSETPLIVANSSGEHVRIPGNMKPRSVAVHPSPTLRAAVGWRSPVAAVVRAKARVVRAHPECGPGVTWSLELRRGATRQRLASGVAGGADDVKVGPIEKIAVRKGDLISVIIGPRNGDHACGLTAVDLELATEGDEAREWKLADDVAGDVMAANPHADHFGNEGVWHFYTEPDKGGSMGPVIPTGSVLARWQSADKPEEKKKLAEAVRQLLNSPPPTGKDNPDAALYHQLASLRGPLFSGVTMGASSAAAGADETEWGLDPAMFGRHPNGQAIDPESLCAQAPSVIEIRLPADLVEGCELVATAALDPATGAEGSAQVQALGAKPAREGLLADTPILAREGSATWRRLLSSFEDFRRIFPAAICYSKIVPVDEVITLTLFHREDDQLGRLMLDEAQKARLDRLWKELHFISRDALTTVDAFGQLLEYASQDSDPRLFEPFRKPIYARASEYRQELLDAEPKQLDGVIGFAALAYRRPLLAAEDLELRSLYKKLRAEELPHEDALRLTMARVLASPAFLYKIEKPGPGEKAGPVNDWELATRLSYFLWSSAPDAELRAAAEAGKLREPDGLAAQARRMLRDGRVRRLAIEFGCQWLHIRDFDELNEKSERHFPTFTAARGDMYEESIQFFTDLFRNDRSILDVIGAKYTFLNEALAKVYGVPGVSGPEWRRVDGVDKFSRGGILAQASTLAKQSGASRTSPILRGNWVCEAILGEKLPKPPKEVPKLPEDETATEGLTVRQLVEKHSTDPMCARCHTRIDPYGFALEGFDAIGRRREKDLGDRPIETKVKALDGSQFDGLDGLRDYLVNKRRDTVLRQFCRKLLGYSLGRAALLSDEPLLDEMLARSRTSGYSVGTAVEIIVRSPQFREIRGIEKAYED